MPAKNKQQLFLPNKHSKPSLPQELRSPVLHTLVFATPYIIEVP